ncbi:hypothetical protein ACIQGZ_16995 [Streptomyces sp. NPDC092296]|uniref:hypothetical protein n=1 Tax=Streptomyces sp. NPDC092296 TaxID=3366012 RepID=UPI003811313E
MSTTGQRDPRGEQHPIARFAREAFAAGWAASGGPLTERVRDACAAAVALAAENADDPDVLKATVDLGRLEGMWALLVARREDQQAHHAEAVTAAWRRLLDRADLAAGVQRFRWQHGLTEADRDDELRAAALAAALAMLRGLAAEPGWGDLRDTLRDAIRVGRAEGMVDAVALAADRAHAAGLDWGAAFQQAYDSLEHLDSLAADADRWLAALVDRAAAALARLLAGSPAGEAEGAEAEAASAAAGFIVDWAMTTAAAGGALHLYQQHGATGVDVVTVGDGRVCAACADAEAGGPWPIVSAPLLPLHPLCRCTYAADIDLSPFASWFT